MMDIREAAAARAAAFTRGDKPKQRSSDERTKDKHVRAAAKLEIRAAADADGPLTFHGIASTTETPYEMYDFFGPYTEIMAAGAFEQTLASNPDVPLVLQHNSLQRIASTSNGTLQLAETDEGLDSTAQLDPEDRDVQYIVPKLRSGLISEMSFAFQITSCQWSPDYTELRINSVDINRGDVSIVGFGANPTTSAEMRAKDLTDLIRDATEEELRRAEAKIRMRLRDFGRRPAMTFEELERAVRR
jgi:HK97 family phage prohead protease